MKKVFFKTLLTRAKNISANERILYSFLASKSIARTDSVFEVDGDCINQENLSFAFEEGNKRLDLCEISHSKLAKELSMSRQSVITGLKHLKELGYIGDDWIYVNEELIEHGYFELIHTEKISGELLIFYSYLLDKSKKYNYCIDTYKVNIGIKLNKTKVAITKLLNRLYVAGLATRNKDGKLVLLC